MIKTREDFKKNMDLVDQGNWWAGFYQIMSRLQIGKTVDVATLYGHWAQVPANMTKSGWAYTGVFFPYGPHEDDLPFGVMTISMRPLK